MDLGGWRPEESRGDAGCCQTHAAVCVGKGSGDSGGGQSLKSLLQRLPACLPGLQRGDKGGKTTSRTTGGFKAPKKKKKPLEMLGTRTSGCSPKRPPSAPFGLGAHAPAASGPLRAVPGVKKKKSTGRGEGGGPDPAPLPLGAAAAVQGPAPAALYAQRSAAGLRLCSCMQINSPAII